MEERLQKVLARAGITSRRGAEKLIEEGRVSVNGRVIREMGMKVDPATDEIRVDTVEVPRAAAAGEGRRTYLLLHKPTGVVCTAKDDRGRRTVLDLVPPFAGKRLFPVGRLDEDSEGIVILTNDGELTQQLTHPSFGVPKTYDVRVKGRLTPEIADKFEGGIWLSEGRTAQSRVQIRRAGPRVTHVAVTLTEGRNREIRRAFAKLGFPVLSLKRIQIGPIVGRGLKAGQFRPLDGDEVSALQALAETGSEVRMRPIRRRASTAPKRRSGKPDPAKAAKKSRGRKSTSRKGAGPPARGGRSGKPSKSSKPRKTSKKPPAVGKRGPPKTKGKRSGGSTGRGGKR